LSSNTAALATTLDLISLLKKGADPNVEDEIGETPLLLCVKTANYAIMGLLIDAGADPQRKNKNDTSLADCDEEMVKKIVAGERVELPTKEIPPSAPSDLNTTRSPLFGRSLPNLNVNQNSSTRLAPPRRTDPQVGQPSETSGNGIFSIPILVLGAM
ncbi:ankyrin repeat protein, partial [Ancylostoma caninum]